MIELPPQSLFLAGVPAAGKTFFGQWLAENKGYLHLDLEKRESAQSNGLESEWNAFFRGDTTPLMSSLAAQPKPVVFNWGFGPDGLPFVKELCACGMLPVWFAASKEVARNEFIKRGGIPVFAFDNQMENIANSQAALGEFFQTCVIFTIVNGVRLPPEDIFTTIAACHHFQDSKNHTV